MIFDTNVLIYADRGLESAKNLIISTPERAISAVTYMEYVPFCRNKAELRIFEKMLEALQFAIYDIDADVSRQARHHVKQYALSHHVEMGDALIATTAINRKELLCTSNAKHFKPFTRLEIEIYKPK
jgi:predicted nucleic acid-binding protein